MSGVSVVPAVQAVRPGDSPSDDPSDDPGARVKRVARRYALAVATIAAACVLQSLVWRFIPPSPELLFYPAVFIVARYAGFGPGILATLMSLGAVAFRFLPPSESFLGMAPGAGFDLAVFASVCVLMNFLVEKERSSARNAALSMRAQEDANRAKDAVLAVVSHDLRNHFGAVSLSAAALARQLRRQHDVALCIETAERIQRAVRLADGLIIDLVEMANFQADGPRLECRVHDVEAMVRDATEVAALLADAKSITLEMHFETSRRVLCDRTRTLQVLSNILGNAIKFTPPRGKVTIRARDEGELVAIAVTDSGPGVARGEAQHIFERYWKGERTGAGTGLGLFIAKSIIAAHGGELRLLRTDTPGATFEFTLPALA